MTFADKINFLEVLTSDGPYFIENKPAKVFKKVSDDLDSGVRFVLLYLTENKGEVYVNDVQVLEEATASII